MNSLPTIPCDEPDHTALIRITELIINEINEEMYCAQWMIGCEYPIWQLVQDPNIESGNWQIEAEILTGLRALSTLLGGWLHWPESCDSVQFIEIEDWLIKYEQWLKKGSK